MRECGCLMTLRIVCERIVLGECLVLLMHASNKSNTIANGKCSAALKRFHKNHSMRCNKKKLSSRGWRLYPVDPRIPPPQHLVHLADLRAAMPAFAQRDAQLQLRQTRMHAEEPGAHACSSVTTLKISSARGSKDSAWAARACQSLEACARSGVVGAAAPACEVCSASACAPARTELMSKIL